MQLRVHHGIDDIPAADWQALDGSQGPFLSHAFLRALEHHGGIDPENGWAPHHLGLYDDDQRLIAAAPAYLKGHSWGEFVFDFAWADAFERTGHPYYPKMISAVPLTPATGPRVLLAPGTDLDQAARALGRGARELVEANGLSSMHWLFPRQRQAEALQAAGYSMRLGLQYHWHNAGYRDFADFLEALSSKKRKNIRRERRKVQEAGVEMRVKHGPEVSAEEWARFHAFYEETFERRGNIPLLSERFFRESGESLDSGVVLIGAYEADQLVAAALCFRDDDTLYGRYWGCLDYWDSLHFETCYYRGIEYCIEHGLQCFEPGAQGEHKIPRGFLPVLTYSLHWITDQRLRAAIDDFLEREQRAVEQRRALLMRHSPYREHHAG